MLSSNLFYILVTRNHIYEVWSDVPGVFDEGGVVQWSFDDIEFEDEKSHRILCNVSGCDFITYGDDEAKKEEHFRNNHKGEELTQDSFILLNSAMADAMEILQEIRNIKAETRK